MHVGKQSQRWQRQADGRPRRIGGGGRREEEEREEMSGIGN
jgi:hypothetical protein